MPRRPGRRAGGVAGLALFAASLVRSARVTAPVIDQSLFRLRSFAVANGAMVLYSDGLLRDAAGQRPVPHAGLWLVGADRRRRVDARPLMAALTAPIGGRLSDLRGQRVVAIPGTLLFAAGIALTATLVDATPDDATSSCPA